MTKPPLILRSAGRRVSKDAALFGALLAIAGVRW